MVWSESVRNIFFGILAVIFLIGGFIAYKDFTTLTVSELNTLATKLDGSTVTIEGTVSQNAGVLGTGGFVVTDGSSNILVLSNGGIPEHGSQIEVTGTFRKAVSLNSFEYSVIYQDDGDR